ncbi:MAG: PAS domain-containing protein [Proteobacteria bacterium]|nr:PAS domain-containing protein [Pseudomonadota bacterium]
MDAILAEDLSEASLLGFRDGIGDETLTALFDYWRGLARGRSLPSRADVDPVRIPRQALAHAMLIDVEWPEPPRQPPFRLRFRLMGTAVVASREGITPQDATGCYLDEIPFRQGYERVAAFYGNAATKGCPAYHTGVYAPDHPRFAGIFHRLALPLSADGRRVNMLLTAFRRGPAPAA